MSYYKPSCFTPVASWEGQLTSHSKVYIEGCQNPGFTVGRVNPPLTQPEGPARQAPAFETTGNRHELAAGRRKKVVAKFRVSGDVAGAGVVAKTRVWRISFGEAPHLIAENVR